MRSYGKEKTRVGIVGPGGSYDWLPGAVKLCGDQIKAYMGRKQKKQIL